MKIQCACGAKYSFDVTPEMAASPIRFVCPACGADSSDIVNLKIRQELVTIAPATPAAPALRIRHHQPTPAPAPAPADEPIPEAPAMATATCAKHPGAPAVEHCRVCQKPMCAKCMELFGYVCSPMCRARADSQGIAVPQYGRQRSVVQGRYRNTVRNVSLAGTAVALVLLGVWIWYSWVGSRPSVAFSVKFEDRAYSGASRICGANQLVFLHGDTLARYDLDTKKEIWTITLLDPAKIHNAAVRAQKAMQDAKATAEFNGKDMDEVKIPSLDSMEAQMNREAAAALQLYTTGQNIWVASDNQLTRYDWATGKPAANISLNGLGGLADHGDEVVATDENEQGQEVVTHINLATGLAHSDVIGDALVARAGVTHGATAGNAAAGGLPVGTPGADHRQALDPAKVAAQAQNLSMPARIALPAVLAGHMSEDRAMAEMDDSHPAGAAPASGPARPRQQFEWIPTRDGAIQFGVKLIESRMVTRNAMKPQSGRSALDGAVTTAQTTAVANEMLNDMQRDRGGATVVEDQSLYHVTVHRPDAKDVPDWSADVTGEPELYPLDTVNVVAAGTNLYVLDKMNKLLWTAKLSYPVEGGGWSTQNGDATYGQAPCVEHNGSLYVADQAVITAFDLANGNVRWRYQSVGVIGMMFDDKDNIYVNTTSASLESVKFSRQIDISRKTQSIILKLDPKTGQKLWDTVSLGFITYVSGKYVYTMQAYQPDDPPDSPYGVVQTGFETEPFVRIRRVDPATGKQMWEHYEQRAPVDAQFDHSNIRLVFRKEVELLKFFSL